MTVIKLGVSDRGSNGTGSCRIEVRPDTAKLTNVIVTGFGERCNSVTEGKVFVKDKAKISSRVGGVKWRVVYLQANRLDTQTCWSQCSAPIPGKVTISRIYDCTFTFFLSCVVLFLCHWLDFGSVSGATESQSGDWRRRVCNLAGCRLNLISDLKRLACLPTAKYHTNQYSRVRILRRFHISPKHDFLRLFEMVYQPMFHSTYFTFFKIQKKRDLIYVFWVAAQCTRFLENTDTIYDITCQLIQISGCRNLAWVDRLDRFAPDRSLRFKTHSSNECDEFFISTVIDGGVAGAGWEVTEDELWPGHVVKTSFDASNVFHDCLLIYATSLSSPFFRSGITRWLINRQMMFNRILLLSARASGHHILQMFFKYFFRAFFRRVLADALETFQLVVPLAIGVNIFRGGGPDPPPLFWSGRTDPHFISTPSQKFCLISLTFQVFRQKLRHCL